MDIPYNSEEYKRRLRLLNSGKANVANKIAETKWFDNTVIPLRKLIHKQFDKINCLPPYAKQNTMAINYSENETLF
jgi:hypothetical protein